MAFKGSSSLYLMFLGSNFHQLAFLLGRYFIIIHCPNKNIIILILYISIRFVTLLLKNNWKRQRLKAPNICEDELRWTQFLKDLEFFAVHTRQNCLKHQQQLLYSGYACETFTGQHKLCDKVSILEHVSFRQVLVSQHPFLD